MNGVSRTSRRALACVAIGVVMCVSCGSDDASSSDTAAGAPTSESPTTIPESSAATSPSTGNSSSPSGDRCEERDALSSSVSALTNVDLRAEGTNGVTAALDAVKADLTALKSSVSADVQPMVQTVQDAVDEVQTAAADLGSGGAPAAVTAVSNLGTAVTALLDSLETCG